MENSNLRKIRKREQMFLSREMEYWQRADLLSGEQAAAIAGIYEPAGERFLQIFIGLGAMLVGLGILSYVAANWMTLGRALKVAVVIGGYLAAVLAAYGLEPSYAYSSRAFLLIGSFAYGGGIFLISQIFNEGGTVTDALFWWMAGTAPACLIFKDKMQLLLIQVLYLVYLHIGSYGIYNMWFWYGDYYGGGLPDFPEFLMHALFNWSSAVCAAVWIIWRLCGLHRNYGFGLHMNVFITLNLLWNYAMVYLNDPMMQFLLFFAIGVFICAAPLGRVKDTLEGWGVTLTGLFGLILSIPDIWSMSRLLDAWEEISPLVEFLRVRGISPKDAFAVASVILACAVLLWRVHKGSLLAASFFGLLILRYYFDFFYDFMNKAMFFTAGGLMLMAMGFYLQRARKKQKGEARQS